MTFVGPCIVIYFYSKTNQMHSISNLFYFGTTLCMFRTVSPSIMRSLRLYIQHQLYVIRVMWLMMDGETETCRVLFQNKINLRYCASGLFYYRNLEFDVTYFILILFKNFINFFCRNSFAFIYTACWLRRLLLGTQSFILYEQKLAP